MTTRFLALAVLVLFHPLLALAQQTPPPPASPYYGPYWHGPWHMWGGGGFWWGGPLMMLGLLAVCIVIFLLGRRSGGGWHHHHHGPWHMRGGSPGPDQPWGDPTFTALQILNERFARGEIQKQEYDEKKAAILAAGPR